MHLLRVIVVILAILTVAARAEVAIPELEAYSLPAEVRQSLDTLASESDVLVFGEVHGTKEVPAVLEGLLAGLTKLGYGALALEVPHDQQPALVAWAKGDAKDVPRFFAKPSTDGRGNQQLLALIRRALRPPFEWKLICFDQTEQEMIERLPKDAKASIAERAAKLTPDDLVAISLERDAAMAKNFAAEREKLPAKCKVLAVCGNMHARTANHATAKNPLKGLWPSFAAVLKRDHPQWQIRSVNLQAFGGEFFNGGKVQKFGERPLAKVEVRRTPDTEWDWELNFPRATAATFLASPHDGP